ncbi:MAG: hypothetical protein FWG49_03125, partial [Leptospirales bacterium]|nr:hypothetical protein [Leptospirales bacterium]
MISKIKILRTLLFIICLSALCASCISGSKGKIKLENVEAPMSMSPYLYGPKGENLSIGDGLEHLGSFFFYKSYYGIFWGYAPLSNDKDVNAAIQQKINELNGDGVVNLHFMVSNANLGNSCGL